MSIRNNGNVGIGTTYPNETLTVANDGSKTAFEAWHDTANNVSLATGSIGVLAYGSAYGGTFTCNFLNGFGVYAYAPQGVGLYGSGVIGVRGLVSSGCGVSGEATSGIGLFGRATTGIALNTYGTVKFQNLPTTSSGTTLIVDGSGYLYKQSSSLRYKENIIDLDVDKQKVLSLRPVKFTSKTDKKRDIGLIAEEVEKQIKDLVIYNEKGQPESVKYDRVAIYLLGVIKGQQKDIDELKREVKELKASEKK
ncbi:MAG TPA: tail fiber domain-containing protein [Candidatus Omnitrophota bacterium]|nr:tail fiber domain-containing protein [Candidatus Omnitrophota bacterium]